MIPKGYTVEELDIRLPGEPELTTRFKWRANWRCKTMEKIRNGTPSYRYEVIDEGNRYLVVAMQNRLVPIK